MLVVEDEYCDVLAIYGQIIHGLLQGPEPFGVLGRLRSDLTRFCLMLIALRNTTASLYARMCFRSDAVSMIFMYLRRIFVIGGFL